VADDLVVAATGAARSGQELLGDAGRDLVEVRPTGLQELEPAFQVGGGEDLSLDRDGTWAMPKKSLELDPGTRSTTSRSRARANAFAIPARFATPA